LTGVDSAGRYARVSHQLDPEVGVRRRTRGEETRVEVIFILPAVLGGIATGYLIAIVASTIFHRATNAIVHSNHQLHI
jgi:hypothetical protein